MNRRRRWKVKHRRVIRQRQDATLLRDMRNLQAFLTEWRDNPDPDKKAGTIALRPPARLRKRTAMLVSRVNNRVFGTN